jgi:polysaccharide export outer membrane protein
MIGGACRRAWILGAALGLCLAGCAARELSPPPPQPDHLDHDPYVIGVRDRLRVSVWKNPELSMEVIVRMDGKISLPLLDDVQAEGLTPMELKEFLTREFSEYVTAPDVTVIVTQMNSQFVLLMGDGIRRNTQVQLTRDMRVLDAIAVGGGFSSFADRDNVRIVRRQDDGTEVEYRFDYDAYIKGRAPGTNIVLKNRDTIIVPD